MSFLAQLFAKRGTTAPVARDRLQILLAHERSTTGPGGEGNADLIAKLREEILEVIARHVPIDRDKVQIKLDRGAAVSTLEIDIEVPGLKPQDRPAGSKPGAPASPISSSSLPSSPPSKPDAAGGRAVPTRP